MEAASIDDLILDIATSGLKGTRAQFDIESQMSVLKKGWIAVDKWIAATLRSRKGVHLPTLCKITWEYLDNSPENEMRMRPIFVLTESFLRGLRLASFQKPVLPQRCAPCEDLNLSQVSIKYSESLTKDTLFVTMRDIVRKISDYVANNKALCLQFQIGKLMAKGKKVWFDFDVNAFADEGFSAPQPSLIPALPPMNQQQQQQMAVNDSSSNPSMMNQSYNQQAQQREVEEEELSQPSHRSSTYSDQNNNYRPQEQNNMNYQQSKYQSSSMQNNNHNNNLINGDDEMDFKSALIAGSGAGGDQCLEDAYARFISNLEKDAVDIEVMESQIQSHQEEVHQAADRLKHDRQAQVDELQQFIKQQMIEKRNEREKLEKEARREPMLSNASHAPILTRDAGVADVLGATPLPPPIDESTLTPRSLMVHRMRSRITDGGIRGKNKGGTDRHHLLAMLQGQIGAKESLARSRKEAELEEERRYLEHVKAEMHLHSTYTKSSELTKQRDLLASWERDGHLKNLNKLKNLGPKAMKDYAKEVLNPNLPETITSGPGLSSGRDSGRGVGGSERYDQPLSSSRSNMSQLSSSKNRNMSVGFDPRSRS